MVVHCKVNFFPSNKFMIYDIQIYRFISSYLFFFFLENVKNWQIQSKKRKSLPLTRSTLDDWPPLRSRVLALWQVCSWRNELLWWAPTAVLWPCETAAWVETQPPTPTHRSRKSRRDKGKRCWYLRSELCSSLVMLAPCKKSETRSIADIRHNLCVGFKTGVCLSTSYLFIFLLLFTQPAHRVFIFGGFLFLLFICITLLYFIYFTYIALLEKEEHEF